MQSFFCIGSVEGAVAGHMQRESLVAPLPALLLACSRPRRLKVAVEGVEAVEGL